MLLPNEVTEIGLLWLRQDRRGSTGPVVVTSAVMMAFSRVVTFVPRRRL